jgi:ABC-type sulfate transport system permease subunit
MNPGYTTIRVPRVRHRGPSGVTHAMVALCAWGVAAVVTLAIAGETKIGPVVVTLTRNHGLHAGDVAAAAIMSLVALAVTVAVIAHYWKASRRARRGNGTPGGHRGQYGYSYDHGYGAAAPVRRPAGVARPHRS